MSFDFNNTPEFDKNAEFNFALPETVAYNLRENCADCLDSVQLNEQNDVVITLNSYWTIPGMFNKVIKYLCMHQLDIIADSDFKIIFPNLRTGLDILIPYDYKTQDETLKLLFNILMGLYNSDRFVMANGTKLYTFSALKLTLDTDYYNVKPKDFLSMLFDLYKLLHKRQLLHICSEVMVVCVPIINHMFPEVGNIYTQQVPLSRLMADMTKRAHIVYPEQHFSELDRNVFYREPQRPFLDFY